MTSNDHHPCPAALNLRGEHFACDWPANENGEHPGWAHANQKAQAIWCDRPSDAVQPAHHRLPERQ